MVQCGEGAVCPVIFHSTRASAQVVARVLSHTTAPVRSTCGLQGNACEDARNVCAAARLVRSQARDVMLQARSQTSIQIVAPLGLL